MPSDHPHPEPTAAEVDDLRRSAVSEDEVEVVRRDEELVISTRREEAGRVRVRRAVDVEHVRQPVTRLVETIEHENVPVDGPDDGEVHTLADGTLSIPRFEERLVVERRRVVVERVLVRRVAREVTDVVEADLARERIELEADEAVADRLDGSVGSAGGHAQP